METKQTKATIRIMNSFNYGNFEVELTIENTEGITAEEVSNLQIKAQDHVTRSVENYKSIMKPEPLKIGKKDNVSISDIENLPLYSEIKQRTQEQKAKKDAKN